MLSSISGQNMPWAQYFANPALSASNASQNGGSGSINTDGDASRANGGGAAGGGFGPRLSDQMDLALLGFAGGTLAGPRRPAGRAATPHPPIQRRPRQPQQRSVEDLQPTWSRCSPRLPARPLLPAAAPAPRAAAAPPAARRRSAIPEPAARRIPAASSCRTCSSLRRISARPACRLPARHPGHNPHRRAARTAPGPSPWDNDITNSGTVTADASGNISGSGTVRPSRRLLAAVRAVRLCGGNRRHPSVVLDQYQRVTAAGLRFTGLHQPLPTLRRAGVWKRGKH